MNELIIDEAFTVSLKMDERIREQVENECVDFIIKNKVCEKDMAMVIKTFIFCLNSISQLCVWNKINDKLRERGVI